MRNRWALAHGLAYLMIVPAAMAQDRKTLVLTDRKDVQEGGEWIYDDFAAGVDQARRTGKPMLVVLRCIP